MLGRHVHTGCNAVIVGGGLMKSAALLRRMASENGTEGPSAGNGKMVSYNPLCASAIPLLV